MSAMTMHTRQDGSEIRADVFRQSRFAASFLIDVWRGLCACLSAGAKAFFISSLAHIVAVAILATDDT
jgi:hypothetical protein